jgi:hypothetical protein
MPLNNNAIRALYDEQTITVYQAYNTAIASAALKSQNFTSYNFKKGRMTWIKPSFLWMMYRSGWATKENQEHILAIKIKREGLEWALAHSCLSHFDTTVYPSFEDWKNHLSQSPVRIQWDPERDIDLNPLNYRAIQIGLSGIAADLYASNWIVQIDDITSFCKEIQQMKIAGKTDQAVEALPIEKVYSLPKSIEEKI